jgi:hypothetical protein
MAKIVIFISKEGFLDLSCSDCKKPAKKPAMLHMDCKRLLVQLDMWLQVTTVCKAT